MLMTEGQTERSGVPRGGVAGLAAVAAMVLVVADVADVGTSSGPSRAASLFRLVLGLVLLGLAVRKWRRRPRHGETSALPKWMQAIDGFTPGKSFALAALLSGVNPKNLILTVSAAATVAQTGVAAGEGVATLAVFVVIGSLSIIAPLGVYFVMGARASATLGGWKEWLAAHESAVMVVLLLVFGVVLVGKGIPAST